jgi:HEAT repeat protein
MSRDRSRPNTNRGQPATDCFHRLRKTLRSWPVSLVCLFVVGLATSCVPAPDDLISELQSPDQSRRHRAAVRAANSRSERVLQALAVAAKVEQNNETRKVLIESLRHATQFTIRDLIFKLADQSKPKDQARPSADMAIDSLVSMGEPALFALASFLVNPEQIPAGEARERAVRNARIAVDRLVRTDGGLVDRLLNDLAAPNTTTDLFRVAGQVLAVLAEQRALPLLLSGLSDSPSRWTDNSFKRHRRAAADSIVAFGPTALPFLTERLFAGDYRVPPFLGRLGELALGSVTLALGHADPAVQGVAVLSLGHMGALGVMPLLRGLEAQDSQVRIMAVEALGVTQDKRAIGPLIPLLTDHRTMIGTKTATVLWSMEQRHAVVVQRLVDERNLPGLLELTQYICLGHDFCRTGVPTRNSPSFRLAAAFAKIGELAIQPLSEKLKSQRAAERSSAAIALGEVGRLEAIPPLVHALRHWHAGPAVASALQKLGWKPSTDVEQVYLSIAKRDKRALEANLSRVTAILLADLPSKDRSAVQNAVFAGVGVGSREFVQGALAFFAAEPNVFIAELFLNSGEPGLRAASENWAKAHGYRIVPTAETEKLGLGWGRM